MKLFDHNRAGWDAEVLTGFFEDHYEPDAADSLSEYIDTFIATRASKPLN